MKGWGLVTGGAVLVAVVVVVPVVVLELPKQLLVRVPVESLDCCVVVRSLVLPCHQEQP